jgi:hypothetical protein
MDICRGHRSDLIKSKHELLTYPSGQWDLVQLDLCAVHAPSRQGYLEDKQLYELKILTAG